jgi:NADH-quinone oxidoreductase subunit J
VTQIVFLVLAALVVLAALGVVLMRNAVHSALCLVSTLFLLAMLFLGLDAELIAILQIIVYAGAIVVLFLFVIMLLNLQTEGRSLTPPWLVGAGAVGSAGMALLVSRAVGRVTGPDFPAVPDTYGMTGPLADRLYTAFAVPFELTSLLLLVAVVGAVALAKRKA